MKNSKKNFEIDRVNIQANDVACDITGKDKNVYSYICFSGENSFLSSASSGLSVKKDGQQVYSKEFSNEMKNLGEAIYCKGAYFIYNYSPGRILKKLEDSSEPIVWWDKSPINNFWYRSKNIRLNREENALIVNLDQTDLILIEVRDDGAPGKELTIKNETGSRIDCHEALGNNKILTVNKKGLLQIYRADYSEFSKSSLLKSSQIGLRSDRSESDFWLGVCEKSRICSIHIGGNPTTSRILIYKIKDETGKDELSFQTQLDVSNRCYLWNGCFLPYIGEKLFLCCHSSSNKTDYISI